jgi:hypothetical protein
MRNVRRRRRNYLELPPLSVPSLATGGRNIVHGRTLHCLGYGFGVAKVVPLALENGFMNCPRTSFTSWPRAQKLVALMVGADASLHANQAQRRRERQRKTGL